jgi:hypothetical protein
VLGQTVQAFASVRDGGRDGAFHGVWDVTKSPGLSGSFTLQCKFTSKTNVRLTLQDLDDELPKAERLAASGKADNYIVMTNAGLTGPNEEAIRDRFQKISGLKKCLVLGSEWLSLKIRETPKLRMLVPRVYGLGDLSQILDERSYAQAEAILSAMRDDLSKFVITDAYRRSADALVDHGFVLLLGEPASGKSSIAACLALGALDLWGCSTLKLGSASEFVTHWNPHEPRQFFWIDDAFGMSHYQREKVDGWNGALPHLLAAVRRGARVLFTSRDYVYRPALSDLRVSAFPLLKDSQVIIEVQGLSKEEREQILYNHIKLGDQDRAFKRRIRQFLPAVAMSHRFLPETARRLGTRVFTRNLVVSGEGVRDFVERPVDFLAEVVQGLDDHGFAALALLFIHGGSLDTPLALSGDDDATLQLLGSDLAGVRNALNALRGTLVELASSGNMRRWTFRHPTISDAIATVVVEDPELLDVYLAGSSTDRVLQEVTCGDVGIEGARVVVPPARFDAFAQRLDSLNPCDRLWSFLARRCNREFLEFYLTRRDFIRSALSAVSSPLGSASSVALLARLHEYGLLPEIARAEFATKASDLVIETPDADVFQQDYVRRLFTEREIFVLRDRVEKELVPSIDDVIDSWQDAYSAGDNAEEHFQPLSDAFGAFANEFDNQPETKGRFISAQRGVDDVANDLQYGDLGDDDMYDRIEASAPVPSIEIQERSVFDDIDL